MCLHWILVPKTLVFKDIVGQLWKFKYGQNMRWLWGIANFLRCDTDILVMEEGTHIFSKLTPKPLRVKCHNAYYFQIYRYQNNLYKYIHI